VAIHTRTCTESQQAFHVEAIGFNLNTMVATLSTFADRLKLFSRFQNRPQFILLQCGRASGRLPARASAERARPKPALAPVFSTRVRSRPSPGPQATIHTGPGPGPGPLRPPRPRACRLARASGPAPGPRPAARSERAESSIMTMGAG
jgi:hypothetical protein